MNFSLLIIRNILILTERAGKYKTYKYFKYFNTSVIRDGEFCTLGMQKRYTDEGLTARRFERFSRVILPIKLNHAVCGQTSP